MATIRDRYVLEIDTKRAESSLFNIRNSLKVVAGAFAAAGAARFATSIVNATTSMEGFRTVLTTYLGSQQKANAELDRLRKLANQLPQDLSDVTQAFTVFTRAGIDTSTKSIRALSNIATANSKSLAQLSEAFADAVTGEFERLKEFGIKVSRENGQVVARIGEDIVAVGDTAAELTRKLVDLGNTKFGAAAAANAGTLSQALSNLRGAAFEAQTVIGENLKAGFIELATSLTEVLNNSGPVLEFIGTLAGGLASAAASAVKLLADNFYILAAAIAAVGITGFVAGVKTTEKSLTNTAIAASYVSGETLKLGSRFGRIAKAAGAFALAVPVIALLGKVIGGLVAALNPVTAAIAVVTGLIVIFKDRTFELAGVTTSVSEIASAAFHAIADVISSIVVPAFEMLKNVFAGLADIVANVMGFVFDTMKTVLNAAWGLWYELIYRGIIGNIIKLPTIFVDVFKAVINSIKEFVLAAGGIFGELWDYVFSLGEDKIENTFSGLGSKISDEFKNIDINIPDLQGAVTTDYIGESIKKIVLARREEVKVVKELAAAEEKRNIQQTIRDAEREAAEAAAKVAEAAKAEAASKTFAAGWKKAFEEFKKSANDAASFASRMFNKSVQGMEDAIVGFAKTGKFEWKEFVLSIQEEMLRANIKQVIANTLSQGGNLNDVIKQFGSISGGAINIPQSALNTFGQLNQLGQQSGFGITAPLQPQTTQVTYNIDAVDAMSFKSLVARDPEFIHAVAEAGARMSPRRV